MSAVFTRRRMGVLGAFVSAGLCVGVGVAVQAAASGGTPSPSSPRVPSAPSLPKPGARPPARPLTASGHVAPDVLATNVHCGQTLTASVTMNGDLLCSGSALTIAKASITLNLNGHEIVGNDTGSGVTVSGTSDIIENGAVVEFATGVNEHGVTDTVTKIRATYNLIDGIDSAGSKAKITSNITYANGSFGIYATGAGQTVTSNRAASNQYGLVINSTGATVSGNFADSNTIDGIYDGGFDNTLTGNSVNFNHNDGILVNETEAIDGGGNLAKGNDYATGTTPEQCVNITCG